MKLWNICPYVRYARNETNRFQSRRIVGVDHRLFLCESGELEIRAAGERFFLREGSLLLQSHSLHRIPKRMIIQSGQHEKLQPK